MGDEAPRTKLIFKLSTLAGEIALQFQDNTSASVVRALFALAESVRLRQRVALTVIDGEPGEPGAATADPRARLDALTKENDRLTRERDEARALYQDAQRALDKMEAHDAPYVDCLCSGCPRKVPQAWASGMCSPCAQEDCEHTDGAKAVAEELATATAENTRLRAAIAPTGENVGALDSHLRAMAKAQHWGNEDDWSTTVLLAVLAAINERAKP